MEQSKSEFIPMIHGITLLKSICPLSQDERTHISLIPYALELLVSLLIYISIKPKNMFVNKLIGIDSNRTEEKNNLKAKL